MTKPQKKKDKEKKKGLYQRGNAWYFRYQKDGRQYWVPLGSDEEAAMREYRELIRKGTVHRSELTVVELAEQWLELVVKHGRSEKNLQLAKVRVEKYLKPHFTGMRVCNMQPVDVRAYLAWLKERGISLQTVKHVLADLRACLRWAEDDRIIERSSFPRRLMPRIEELPPDRLTDGEVERLLTVPERYRYVIQLALTTGLRWGELTRVRAEDWRDGMLEIYHTKSGRLRRVPCPREFVRGRVGRLCAFSSASSFKRAVRHHARIAHFHPHQLRHTFASRWLERGGSLASLQEVLGHASVTTTQRYARLSEFHVRAEAARLGCDETVKFKT